MKINMEVFKKEYKKNIKREKKRYGKKFVILLFVLLFLYSIIGEIFDYSLMYNGICVIIIYSFLVFWDYKNPKE